MLELRKICKSYTTGDFTQKALDNISVTFRDSEFVAVLGPSGSGKTTLLNVIGGLDHYDSGDLLINGKSTKQFKDQDWDHYRNNQVGFVFQNYNLIPHQTVLSNVELALTLSGISKDERKSKATKALQDVGLAEHVNKKPNQLSGGQMQRVAIARAIVNDPNIIFADEPTGALDTKTSIQIMDILKEISKDRLVVMVTHNPEIAEKYATRIVNLKDAKIVGDSSPFDVKKDAPKKFRKTYEKGKTAMSFLTALSLSFANLMGKKGRTFMTAFAGSIGIIGISGILALSTGTNLYIKNVENNTLSQYPLYITRSKSVIGEFSEITQGNGGLSEMIQKMRHNEQEDNTIGVRTFLTKMLTTSGNNDLRSLKNYIGTNPKNFNSYTDSIEYSYSTKPVIYTSDNSGVREVYPANTLSSVGSSNSSYTSASQNTNNGGTSMTSGFSQLPKDENLYNQKYTIAAGHWPKNANECVLVLHQDGTINDSLLYTLGLRNNDELVNALKNFRKDEKVDLPEEYDNLTYDQVLGIKFKVINPSDIYVYNSSAGVWEDKSNDKEYMKTKVDAASDLTVVGIVNPPEGNNKALALTAGINYTYQLSEKCIDYARNTQIVQDQLSKTDVDVLTGKSFAEEKSNGGFDPSVFSNILEINPEAFYKVFNFDYTVFDSIDPKIDISQEDLENIVASAITPEMIEQIIVDISESKGLTDSMQTIVSDACEQFIEYKKEHPEETAQHYFSKSGQGYDFIVAACAAAGIETSDIIIENLQNVAIDVLTKTIDLFSNAILKSLSNISMNLSSLDKAFSFNQSALSELFKFNMTQEKLLQLSKLISGAGVRTYESNLADFGYADLDNPLAITIYPNDFYAKEKISDIIDDYNNENQENGHEEKVISYSDYAKLLMSSITTMIDMITAVLVAFVAISLVVSSIMIGIITYISVLERRREIGILRAIGARKRDIFNVFNAETFIIGIVAGLIGISVTALGCIPANIIARAVFNVEYDIAILPLWAAIVLIFISVFLTFVAGLIPSTSASKKDPVEAINS